MELLKQKYNTYDSLKLSIPAGGLVKPDWNKFYYTEKFDSETDTLIPQQSKTQKLKETGRGINNIEFIPHQDYWDITISGKILRKDYNLGISGGTIDKVFNEFVDRGICKDIDTNIFLKESTVRRADNTFNIKVEGENMSSYYDSLNYVSVDVKKGKVVCFDQQNIGTTGVIMTKNITRAQPITIYNKIEESKNLFREKGKGESIEVFCEKEYGMDYNEFMDYFEKRLRVELRITDYNNLRKYTGKYSGPTTLKEMLESPYNVVGDIFNKTINRNKTLDIIKRLDLPYQTTKLKEMSGLNDFSVYYTIMDLMDRFKGDDKLVMKFIDETTYKQHGIQMGYTVSQKVKHMCKVWKREQLRKIKGVDYTNELTSRYKEIDKLINNL